MKTNEVSCKLSMFASKEQNSLGWSDAISSQNLSTLVWYDPLQLDNPPVNLALQKKTHNPKTKLINK